MGTTPAPPLAPASAGEAIEMMHAGLGYLAAADAAALGAETQAWCLRALEEAAAVSTAARASVRPRRSPPGRGTARMRITARGRG